MLRGLYESAMGMMARQAHQDITANNLANVNSTGFQREVLALSSRFALPEAKRSATASPFTTPIATDPISVRDTTPGTIQPTGNPHDVALSGPGYLMVQSANGPRLVRSASLTLNNRGEVALPTGEPILGVSGAPIPLGGSDWKIDETGSIRNSQEQLLGRMRLVQAQGPVTPAGNGMSIAQNITSAAPGSVTVLSGSLERSNVDPIREMVNMITGVRAYEAGQKSVQAQDSTLENLFTLLR
ncbi:flagellar hook-basal body protein [Armatimonas sp.]|uniref:flagellar hook-basal body protein n=1 Tax=Armatimonas sp. TaxID=1872638 RepID=UPI003751BA3C